MLTATQTHTYVYEQMHEKMHLRTEVLEDFLIHNGFYMLGQNISVSFPSLFNSTLHPSFCLTVLNHILLVQNVYDDYANVISKM